MSDTRLVDALARLQCTGELSIPVPDIVDDAAYAVECAALGEADFGPIEAHIEDLEFASRRSKRGSGRGAAYGPPSSPTPSLASTAMTDTELQVRELVPAPESAAAQPVQRVERVTTIKPAPRRPHLDVPELWHYRELLGRFVWRDIKVRYKQTSLGVAWALLVRSSPP